MRRIVLPLLLVAVTACAERQDHRSSVEAACAAEAERLVLQRNRGRSVRIDSASGGPGTIMEETNVSDAFARQGEFRERERLTRECIRQTDAAQNRPAITPSPAPPASATPAPAAAPASGPGTSSSAPRQGLALPPPAPLPASSSGAPQRGTALPPPPPEQPTISAPASAEPARPIRGW